MQSFKSSQTTKNTIFITQEYLSKTFVETFIISIHEQPLPRSTKFTKHNFRITSRLLLYSLQWQDLNTKWQFSHAVSLYKLIRKGNNVSSQIPKSYDHTDGNIGIIDDNYKS